MSKKVVIISALVSGVVGFAAALILGFVFFFFVSKTIQVSGDQPDEKLDTPAESTPSPEIPNPEIKLADVKSVGINTVYKDYFEKGSKCSKTYNELFGNRRPIRLAKNSVVYLKSLIPLLQATSR